MPQPPLKVDQLQIAPGLPGSRVINDDGEGSLQFSDILIPDGITLSELAGLKTLFNFLIVSVNGAGASYNTIQEALDAVPSTSNATNPWVILIGPGVYAETLNICRDGVTLQGLGRVVISPVQPVPNGSGAYHTAVVQAANGTVPQGVVFKDLTITNCHDGFAAVRIVGGASSRVGLNNIRFENVWFAATAPGGNKEIWATAANFITMQNGGMSPAGYNNLATTLIENCYRLTLSGVQELNDVTVTLNPNNALPETDSGLPAYVYNLSGCPVIGILKPAGTGVSFIYTPAMSPAVDVTSYFQIVGGGVTPKTDPPGVKLTLTNAYATVSGTKLGPITLVNSRLLMLDGTSRLGTITADADSTIGGFTQTNTVTLTAQSSLAVTFPVAMYGVPEIRLVLTSTGAGGTPWISGLSATGFTVNFASTVSLSLTWTAEMRV